ncbi:hypothetical protein FACS1894191_4710 [Clostridia bacterium]|nr:hypothetical protein FACS1894191_4710 [Clostridia bacterium]
MSGILAVGTAAAVDTVQTGLLNPDWTFVWTAINLVVLYLFLKKFLFDKVGKYMENRSKAVEDSLKKAEQLTQEGNTFLAEQKRLLDEAQNKRRDILAEAQAKAVRDSEAAISEAREESARIIARAEQEIKSQREQMMASLRSDVASLALSAASKVVAENMDTDRNRRLVEEFLDREGVA